MVNTEYLCGLRFARWMFSAWQWSDSYPVYCLVHDQFKMCQPSPFHPVMLDIPCPSCTLNIHDDPWLRVLQLHHNDRTEVPTLVPVRVKVSGEASVWSVGNLQNKVTLHMKTKVGAHLPVQYFPCPDHFLHHNVARPCLAMDRVCSYRHYPTHHCCSHHTCQTRWQRFPPSASWASACGWWSHPWCRGWVSSRRSCSF